MKISSVGPTHEVLSSYFSNYSIFPAQLSYVRRIISNEIKICIALFITEIAANLQVGTNLYVITFDVCTVNRQMINVPVQYTVQL